MMINNQATTPALPQQERPVAKRFMVKAKYFIDVLICVVGAFLVSSALDILMMELPPTWPIAYWPWFFEYTPYILCLAMLFPVLLFASKLIGDAIDHPSAKKEGVALFVCFLALMISVGFVFWRFVKSGGAYEDLILSHFIIPPFLLVAAIWLFIVLWGIVHKIYLLQKSIRLKRPLPVEHRIARRLNIFSWQSGPFVFALLVFHLSYGYFQHEIAVRQSGLYAVVQKLEASGELQNIGHMIETGGAAKDLFALIQKIVGEPALQKWQVSVIFPGQPQEKFDHYELGQAYGFVGCGIRSCAHSSSPGVNLRVANYAVWSKIKRNAYKIVRREGGGADVSLYMPVRRNNSFYVLSFIEKTMGGFRCPDGDVLYN